MAIFVMMLHGFSVWCADMMPGEEMSFISLLLDLAA